MVSVSAMIDFELAFATNRLVKELLAVDHGEEVLVLCDTGSDTDLAFATASSVYLAGGIPIVSIHHELAEIGLEPPGIVSAAMRNADVIIEYSAKYTIHTKAITKALEAGARGICLTGMTKATFVRAVGRPDPQRMKQLAELMRDRFSKAKNVKVVTGKNAQLEFINSQRRPVQTADGYSTQRGKLRMLGGGIGWAPIEKSINGEVVFDACVWPPSELGLLREVITIRIEKGRIVEAKGSQAKVWESWLSRFHDRNMYNVAHVSLGFNPGVVHPTGQIAVDERLFGCYEMGFGTQSDRFKGSAGKAKSHTDAVAAYPSIWLDDEPFEKEGRYVDPEIAELCKQLGAG